MIHTCAAIAQASPVSIETLFQHEGLSIKDTVAVTIVVSLIVWGISLIAEALRRMQQNFMQKNLLQKFASAHDFAEFLQTPAGQNYVMSFSDAMADPRSSILNSLRIGIVLVFLGIGCFVGGEGLLRVAGNVILFLGLGFIVSSGVAYRLSQNIRPGKAD